MRGRLARCLVDSYILWLWSTITFCYKHTAESDLNWVCILLPWHWDLFCKKLTLNLEVKLVLHVWNVSEWLEFTKTVFFGLDFLPTGQFIEINFVITKFNSKKLIHIYFLLCKAGVNGIPFMNHGQCLKDEHMERHELNPMSRLTRHCKDNCCGFSAS